ncbi:MAG: 4Fe-4S binding protein [Candidatus Thermoplasmatota archaeon]|nr:4Fe-4S binding protein [Candidatus Thermoplasmatota archaeon]
MSDIVKKTIRPFRALRFLGRKPHTIKIPHEQHNDLEGDPLPTERYRGVHVNDWDQCISCGLCAMVCPCDAIEMVDVEGEEKKRPEVSYGRCCFCGFCEDACPKKCMHLTSNHTMIDDKTDTFVFLPTPFLEEFEHEYMVEPKNLCMIKRTKDGNKIVQGEARSSNK